MNPDERSPQDALEQQIKEVLHHTIKQLLPQTADPDNLIAPHVWRDSNYVGTHGGKVVVWRGWRVSFAGSGSPYGNLYIDVVENVLPVPERERLFGEAFTTAVAGLSRFVVMYALDFPLAARPAILAAGFVPRHLTRVLHACIVADADTFLQMSATHWADETVRLLRLQSEWRQHPLPAAPSRGALETYLRSFATLNANKNAKHWTADTTHRAPHKPLLLLAVIDLFAQGSIYANLIELDTELIELFGLHWGRVRPPSQRGHVTYPFYYMQSESFWHLLPRPGQETALAAYRPNAGLHALQQLIFGARLDDNLYTLLQTAESRNLLRATLLETYFSPAVQSELLAQAAINLEAFHYSQELLTQARTHTLKETPTPAEQPRTTARDQGFRRAVVTAYDHRCALCGIRMLTPDGHTAVAAALLFHNSQFTIHNS